VTKSHELTASNNGGYIKCGVNVMFLEETFEREKIGVTHGQVKHLKCHHVLRARGRERERESERENKLER
jgi:hypothetical protein